jgi:hypothetical protein
VSRYERGIATLTDIAVLRRFASALAIAPETLGLADAQVSGAHPNVTRRRPCRADAVTGSPAGSGMAAGPGSAEVVRPYADRGLVTRHQWNGDIRGAASQLWLYGMAEFGYATDDDVPRILRQATSRGCRVRVLLLNPESPQTEAIDRDEGYPGGTLAARTRAALTRYCLMRQACGQRIQIRVYGEYPTVSVVRGDNAMLVTPYLRFFIGSNSPTFEFCADQAPRMFPRYTRHFKNTWNHAEEWTR